jgi:hypothetical protein
MGGARESCPFLLLRVRRGAYLLRDTLMQINNAKNNGSLKKPLKVSALSFVEYSAVHLRVWPATVPCSFTRVLEQLAS